MIQLLDWDNLYSVIIVVAVADSFFDGDISKSENSTLEASTINVIKRKMRLIFFKVRVGF